MPPTLTTFPFTLGQVAYEDYATSRGWWSSISCQPMPSWSDLPQLTRLAWDAEALATFAENNSIPCDA